MVLRKLSQTLMVSLAFMVATFSSGLLQPAVAYAHHKADHSEGGTPVEEVVVNQTCDDVTTPGSDGWTTKFNDGYGDTVLYDAPSGFLVDQYCVKAGSAQQEDGGPIIVPVTPPAASVTIDYPEKDSISHYVVHLIPDTTQTLVSPVAPTSNDVCGTDNDSIVLPTDSAQIIYTLNGNVVTATLVNPTTHDFGTTLNGYVVATDGLTATFSVTFTDEPCVVPNVCENPTDGGAITQNTAGWILVGDAEFVDGAVSINSNNWTDGGISFTGTYSLADVQNLSWSLDTSSVTGAYGVGILLETADGDVIHYEPVPYTDDFWSNSPVLPANGGGQGGPYSGSLQDALDTIGNVSIVKTTFVFTSNDLNEGVLLTGLSFNCTNYTFNEEIEEDDREKYSICHAIGNENKDEYVFIKQISAAGIYNGHYGVGNGDHQNAEDIIPPFEYQGQTYSQNWDAAGQAIYRADCKVEDEEPNPMADIDYALVCVEDGVKVTLTNSGDASGTATVNGTVYTVAANSTKEVVLDYDLGTPFMTEVTITIGQDTEVETVNCTPGGGGGTPVTPTTPGQTLGTSTVAAAVLPAVLPATGGIDSPFMVVVASILAYGAAYFLQGRRLIARKEAIQA